MLLDRDAPARVGEDAAGVVVLAPDGDAFADDVAAAWMDELGGNGSAPPVVSAVATQARTVAAGTAHDGRIARARVRTESGRWLVVRGSVLADEPGAQVAVMIEPARPHELAPLVADAYRLTEREREVTRLVARGLSTGRSRRGCTCRRGPCKTTSRPSSRRSASPRAASSSHTCSSGNRRRGSDSALACRLRSPSRGPPV